VLYPGDNQEKPQWYFFKAKPLEIRLTKRPKIIVPIHEWIPAWQEQCLNRFTQLIPDPAAPPVTEDDDWEVPRWV
jgi:hypothetical protein